MANIKKGWEVFNLTKKQIDEIVYKDKMTILGARKYKESESLCYKDISLYAGAEIMEDKTVIIKLYMSGMHRLLKTLEWKILKNSHHYKETIFLRDTIRYDQVIEAINDLLSDESYFNYRYSIDIQIKLIEEA